MNAFELLIQPISKLANSNTSNFAKQLEEARNLPVVNIAKYKDFLVHIEVVAMEQGNHNAIKAAKKALSKVSSLSLSEKASVANREFNPMLYLN